MFNLLLSTHPIIHVYEGPAKHVFTKLYLHEWI